MASPTINLNDSLPAPPVGGVNVKWQFVTSVHSPGIENVSAYIPTTALPTGAPTGTFHGLTCDGQPPFNNPVNISGNLVLQTCNQFGWNGTHAGGTFAINNSGVSGATPPNWKLTSGSGSFGFVGNNNSASEISLDILAQCQAYLALGLTSSGGYWIGMSSLAAGSLSVTNPSGSVVAFRFIQGTDTNWQAYVATGSGTFTAVDTGVAPDTNFHQFKIQQDSSGNLTFYIDGSLVATINSGTTGIPVATTAMLDLIYCYVGSGTVTMLLHSMGWYSKF